VAAGYFREADVDDIVKSVLRREQLGSTGTAGTLPSRIPKHAAPIG
jgi:hypothetical protein